MKYIASRLYWNFCLIFQMRKLMMRININIQIHRGMMKDIFGPKLPGWSVVLLIIWTTDRVREE